MFRLIHAFFLCFFILFGNDAFSVELPELKEMEAKALQRVRSYGGLEFSVKSSLYREHFISKQDGSNEKQVTSLPEVKEMVRLHFPEKGHSWKYWIQEIPDSFDKQWVVNSFKVTNVLATHNFFYSPEAEGIWSDGNVTPWYEWDEEEGRYFFTFLGMGVSCISFLYVDETAEIRKLALENLSKCSVTKGTIEEQQIAIFRNRFLEGNMKNMEIDIRIVLPHMLIVHADGRDITDIDGQKTYNVEKIGFFEGICYPQKGSIRQKAPTGIDIDRIDYQFEVTDVRRFEPELLQNWFPEWPSSTIVHDIATDKTQTIPPSERQLKKVAEQWNSYEITQRSAKWMGLRITLIIAGLALMLYALYRMRQGK